VTDAAPWKTGQPLSGQTKIFFDPVYDYRVYTQISTRSEIVVPILDLQTMGRLQSLTMRFYWPATIRMIRIHFAVFVLLWWGGLNCLSGCLIPKAGANGESHCSMSGAGGDCCQTQAGGEESVSSKSVGAPSTSIQSPSCCSLLSLSGEAGRDVRATDSAAASAISGRIEFTLESKPRVQVPERWARLPDCGGTYLLHCVFLI
jgi:hypothetical protein